MTVRDVPAGANLLKSIPISCHNGSLDETSITVECVKRVVENLEPSDAQRFVRDLQSYSSTGERSAFLLSVLDAAAKEMHGKRQNHAITQEPVR